jgi:hypothetical protein
MSRKVGDPDCPAGGLPVIIDLTHTAPPSPHRPASGSDQTAAVMHDRREAGSP